MPRINKIIYLFTALRVSWPHWEHLTVCIRSPGPVSPGSHPSKLFMVLKVSDWGRSQPTESDSECHPLGCTDQSEASIEAPLTNQRPVLRPYWPMKRRGWEEFFQQMDTAVIINSRVSDHLTEADHARSEVYNRPRESLINPWDNASKCWML